MYLLHKIDSWSEKHHPLWLDIFRVLLGIILIWQAIYFISNKSAVIEIVQKYGFGFYTMTAAHGIIGIHLVGGLLILTGLLTRFAAALQIPVLICNIIFILLPSGFMQLKPEAGLTILVLALSALFLFEGSGTFSLDGYLNRHKD